MKAVTIYTDGACHPNPGPGGWAAIILWSTDNVEELVGNEKYSTNNRMEMTAVIEGLKALGNKPYEVDIMSDSSYVVNGFNKKWVEKWKLNNWQRSTFDGQLSDVKNKELWMELDKLISFHTVHFHWVKGHADNKYNNRCDELAVAARNSIK